MPHSAPPPRPRAGRLFLAAAVALAAVLGLCVESLGAYVSATQWLDHTLEIRKEVYEWLAVVLDAETGARGYVATDQPAFLEPYESALKRERVSAERIRGLVAGSATQVQNFGAADRDAQLVMDDLGALVDLVKSGRRDEAVSRLASGESKQLMDRFRVDNHAIRSEEHRVLLERRADARREGLVALFAAVLLALCSCGLLALAWRREAAHFRAVAAVAADARTRLKTLSELAAALSDARSRSEVARVVVDHGMRAAGADTCTLYELDDSGEVLELVGDRGVSADVIEKIRQVTATTGNPGMFATMKSGAATWVENEGNYAKLFPALANLKAQGRRAKAFWSMPLIAEGRPLGLLGVGFYENRRFSPEERDVVETLAKHCAQALLRASRMEGEEEARSWFTTTLRSIGDAVIATDARGCVTFMNHVAETLTGWTEGDAEGRPLEEVFEIISEQTRAAVESPVAKVLREGGIVGLANHTVLRSRAGVEIPIDDSGAPIRNEGGRVLGVVLVFRDVTSDKRDRARSEFLAKAGEALVASIDYQATLATVARFAVPTLADWCAVELLEPGANASKQVAVAHVDEGKRMVVPLRVRGRSFGAITFVYAESGRCYSEDDLTFAEDFARRAAMAIENALFLKETEEARAKERVLRGEAELASRAKDQFLATVSHELRTPLNAILGWTVTLRQRKQAEDVDRALAIVERNARVQTKLIEDVLDISRIISGKLELNLGPTNVAEAVSAAIETVTPAAQAKDINTSIDVPDGSLTFTADADRLQQIVWNLLSNAVKFTPKGGSVTVGAFRDGSEVCIFVSDTGEGIRSEVLPLVFDPFQQADASTTRRHGGLGLGLSIVKQLVSAHGGTVRAESEGEGKGAKLTVRLPARAVVPAISRKSSSNAVRASAAGTNPAPRLDGLRLLVVDDEEDALVLVGEVLREQGAEVHFAASALEALVKFEEIRPDVIVSDIGMPGVDGLSLIRQVRALTPQQGGRTPAVALTAYARAEEAQRAFAAGYQMHVAKPVEPTHLATVVANLGGRSLDAAAT